VFIANIISVKNLCKWLWYPKTTKSGNILKGGQIEDAGPNYMFSNKEYFNIQKYN